VQPHFQADIFIVGQITHVQAVLAAALVQDPQLQAPLILLRIEGFPVQVLNVVEDYFLAIPAHYILLSGESSEEIHLFRGQKSIC
jgi:hypothetical protein